NRHPRRKQNLPRRPPKNNRPPAQTLKFFAAIFTCFALIGTGLAQLPALNSSLSTRSVSGQFQVGGPVTHTHPRLISQLTSGGDFVQLNPSLLIVSCERIKQLLWRKLTDKPVWHGRIYLELRT